MKQSLIKKTRPLSVVIISILLCMVVTLKGIKQKTISELTSDRVAYHPKRADITLPLKHSSHKETPQHETAILDRFENGHAILLLEASQQEIILPKQMLPNQVLTDTWFDIWTDPLQNIITLTINGNRTKQKREHARQARDQLRQK